MRNLKKLMAGALALALAMGMTLSVSAAETVSSPVPPSDGTPSAVTSEDGEYIVEPLETTPDKSLAGVDDEAKDAIFAVNEAKAGATTDAFIADINASSTPGAGAVASELNGKKWLTTFFEVRPEGNAKTEDVTLTLTVAGIGSYAKEDVTFVHYNAATGKWETLEVVEINGDKVTVKYASFSPTAVAVVVKPKTDDSSSSTTNTTSSSKKNSSPKTGVAAGWELYMLAAAALAGCGVSFSRKKKG